MTRIFWMKREKNNVQCLVRVGSDAGTPRVGRGFCEGELSLRLQVGRLYQFIAGLVACGCNSWVRPGVGLLNKIVCIDSRP